MCDITKIKNHLNSLVESKTLSQEVIIEKSAEEFNAYLLERIEIAQSFIEMKCRFYNTSLILCSILHFNMENLIKDSNSAEMFMVKVDSYIDYIASYLDMNDFINPTDEINELKNSIKSIVEKYTITRADKVNKILSLIDEL